MALPALHAHALAQTSSCSLHGVCSGSALHESFLSTSEIPNAPAPAKLSSSSGLQDAAVKPVCFAESLARRAQPRGGLAFSRESRRLSQPRMAHTCGNQNKLKKEPCRGCTPGLALHPSACPDLGYLPPFLLPVLRGEQAEGFAHAAEPESWAPRLGTRRCCPARALAWLPPSLRPDSQSLYLPPPPSNYMSGWKVRCLAAKLLFISISGL